MNIEQLRKERALLECEITKSCRNLVNRFRDKTGISPDCITIKLIDASSFSEPNNYVVASAEVSILV